MARDANAPSLGRRTPAQASWLHRLTGDIDRRFMAVAVVAGLLFAILTVLVALHPAPFFFDRPIEVAVQSVSGQDFAWFNAFVSAFSGFVGIGVGAAVIATTFLLRRPATPLVAFSAIYSAIYNIVNIIVRRPRPTGVAHTTSKLIGYSYPSGHVGFFVWLSVLAMVLLARKLPRPLYIACWFLAAALVVAAALSRIYVGAHWPSDVVAGFLVGVAWTSLSLSLGRLTEPVFGSRQASSRRSSARAA
ncbi:MAG: phosphatase PAP2 family protein [Candidatus Dormiibacterota bacterium]